MTRTEVEKARRKALATAYDVYKKQAIRRYLDQPRDVPAMSTPGYKEDRNGK